MRRLLVLIIAIDVLVALALVHSAVAGATSRGILKGWPVGTGQRADGPLVAPPAAALLGEDGLPIVTEDGNASIVMENAQ